MRESHSVDSDLAVTTLDDMTRSGKAKINIESRRSGGRRW